MTAATRRTACPGSVDARLSRLESDRHLAVSLREWGRAAELERKIGRLRREEHDRMLVKAGRAPM